MYDIKIFLENNGKFGARINAGKEVIYGVGDNQEELMNNLKEGLELSFPNKKRNSNISQLFSYFNADKKDKICH